MDIGYGRVSTEEQNLDLQFDAFERAGIPTDDLYIDKISGAKSKRTALDLSLKRLREGDRFVVWKVDRLGRDVFNNLSIANTLNELGVEFKSLTEPMVDIKTPLGRYMFILLTAHGQLEREQLIERTLAGMESAKLRGRPGGRKNYLSPDDVRQLKIQLALTEDSLDDIAPRFRIKRRTIFNYVKGGRVGLLARLQSGEEALDVPRV
jgi:DNA invertase Pin-like site-specific DNA recombinase